jgi:nicotinamidase/pyrazinamidase
VKEALLVIDMLNDFCREGAPLYVPSTREVIPNIAREVKRAREEGVPVVYICDAHAVDDPEFAEWPPHAVAGTEGARVIEELAPLPGDIVVEKTTLFGFHNTRLGEKLKRTGAELLTVTGTVTNICVLLISSEARMHGYKLRIFRDCVAGLDPQMHEFALREMAEVLGAEVI